MTHITNIRHSPHLFALLFLICCWGMPAEAQKWRFLVFSDAQSGDNLLPINTNILTELVQVITNERPHFVLYGGDFANTPSLANFQGWKEIMAPVYEAGIPVYGAVGNHDYTREADYTNVFGPYLPTNGPAGEIYTTYAVQHSNVLVLMLNAYNPTNILRVNQRWIDAVLATNTQPHIFAMSHVPAFKILHTDCLGTYPRERDAFWTSLGKAGGRIYFSGHDHFYDHTRLDDQDGNPDNDLHQMVVATGGGYPYPDGAYDGTNGIWTPLRILHESPYGYVTVEIDGARATTTWCRRTGPNRYEATSETFSYTASPSGPELRFNFSPQGLRLTWSGNQRLERASQPTGPFTEVPGATSPYVITNLSEVAEYYRLAEE